MNEQHSSETTSTDNDENLPQDQRLISVLYSLESHIQRQNSLKYTLLKGVVYGLGTVIGASVLVALFGGFIVGFVNSILGGEIITEEVIEQ